MAKALSCNLTRAAYSRYATLVKIYFHWIFLQFLSFTSFFSVFVFVYFPFTFCTFHFNSSHTQRCCQRCCLYLLRLPILAFSLLFSCLHSFFLLVRLHLFDFFKVFNEKENCLKSLLGVIVCGMIFFCFIVLFAFSISSYIVCLCAFILNKVNE